MTSLAITSTPSSGSTYQLDEVIVFTVTFNGNVTVDTTGTPYFSFSIGGESRDAAYVSGSDSKELVFSYTVVGGDNDGDGISWGANGFSLNGGRIELQPITSGSFSNHVRGANLDHSAVGAQSAHLVDTPPTLLSAEVSGSELTLVYSEGLDSSSEPAVGDFLVSVDSGVEWPPLLSASVVRVSF